MKGAITPPISEKKKIETVNKKEISQGYLRYPYVRTMYKPPLLGNHGDDFWRSSLCDLPPHAPAPPRLLEGRIQKSPTCRDRKWIRSPIPHHLVVSADCHQVFPQRFYVGLGMVQCVLLRKQLGTIPSISPIPDNTASACNWPRRGYLRLLKICQLQRPAKSVLVACIRRLVPPSPSTTIEQKTALSTSAMAHAITIQQIIPWPRRRRTTRQEPSGRSPQGVALSSADYTRW